MTATVTLPSAPPREDLVTNRDEASLSTAYPVRSWLQAALDLRYQNERALDQTVAYREALTRTHITAVPPFPGRSAIAFTTQRPLRLIARRPTGSTPRRASA